MSDFISLGISKELADRLRTYGVAVPTPIQQQAIPFVMKGDDVIAQAQTGTGKTFAFILPIIEKIDRDATHVQALIVAPTRELALQITEEIEKMIADIQGLAVLAVYGGQDVDKQLKKLKRHPQIVVGTPGRLLDHIRRETVRLGETDFLVLDEADQMLHIGFLNEVEEIIRETPATRQTMLFSATMPPEIRKLAAKHMRNPNYIQIEKTQGPAISVKQLAFHTTDRAKQATLIKLIETHRPFLAVIFCRTKRRVSKLYDALKAYGFSCDELHGDLSQAKRERVMKRFRDAEIQLLVATDVAARGLDVEGITHVFNYDIPEDAESYVHRIGRTGRAGMTGLAVTFYSSDDRPALEQIEKELSINIPKQSDGNPANEKNKSEEGNSERRHTRPAKTHGLRREKQKKDQKDGNRDNKNGNDRRSDGSSRGAKKESTKKTSVMKDSRGKRTNFSSSSKSNRGSGRPTTARSSRNR
ncbi:DEAD/DEAH box helicase [Neobacillus vireti]|uniref:DEAD/DEAH box helicase n=1 Tax=Neobacillus vireti TaxID=220686 RepID=UPI003000A9BB